MTVGRQRKDSDAFVMHVAIATQATDSACDGLSSEAHVRPIRNIEQAQLKHGIVTCKLCTSQAKIDFQQDESAEMLLDLDTERLGQHDLKGFGEFNCM